MKTLYEINIKRFFTPFISDKDDRPVIKVGNFIMNCIIIGAVGKSVYTIITHDKGFVYTMEMVIFTLLAFLGAGAIIQICHPVIKAKIGRKAGEIIGDNGIDFISQEAKEAIIEYLNNIEDGTLDASKGMSLSKALKSSGMLQYNYNEADIARWLYSQYKKKYTNGDYAESTIIRPSHPEHNIGKYSRDIDEIIQQLNRN